MMLDIDSKLSKWSASRPCRFIPAKEPPVPTCTGYWVCPKVGEGILVKTKLSEISHRTTELFCTQ
jgi:hypothetical protein